MAAGYSLKDDLFNARTVGFLARQFESAGAFSAAEFEQDVLARFPELELKARIAWISECLCERLPADLATAAPVLRAALPPPLDPRKTDDDFGSFIIAPLGDVVVRLGLDQAPDLSLDLMEDITQRFSMEMSIRPFLARWPDKVLDRMNGWAGHANYHVRRLVSEGTRPKLPWAQSIPIDPAMPLPLLDRLHADPTRYVTRSVANHLNDITKIAPDLALERLRNWREAGRQRPDELSWMTMHALRGLIKAGDDRALAMLGFDPEAKIDVQLFDIPAEASIGETILLNVSLQAEEDTGAMIDYVFWRLRANGALAPKVHKLRKTQLKSGRIMNVQKAHHLKGDATTYKLYPGRHRISLQINGKIKAEAEFELKPN